MFFFAGKDLFFSSACHLFVNRVSIRQRSFKNIDMKELINFLIPWAKKEGYDISLDYQDPDKEIDFININNKTRKVYFGDLDIENEIAE